MSSSKSNKKWKQEVLDNFFKRGKFIEGSIYKFQDRITLTDCPNDVPLQRKRVFEKTVYGISKIDKEDIKRLLKKDVKQTKYLDASPDKCELIAEIDKKLKHLRKQKKFFKMDRECKLTWNEHLSANEYAREKNCNQRTSSDQCQTGCGSTRVCDVLQKLIDRNRVKVADSYTQIESPIGHRRCNSGGNYYVCQCGTNGYQPQYDCNTYDDEWKARINNCNFRPCPTGKVKKKVEKLPTCCYYGPKQQRRTSVCNTSSQGSSPRYTTVPHVCSEYVSRSPSRGRLRTKDYHSEDCRDRFQTTYMKSYRPQSAENYASGSKGECLRQRATKTNVAHEKPKPPTPRPSRKHREDSIGRDIRRMPCKPESVSDVIEKCRWEVRRKSPMCRDFPRPSTSHVSPRSPRKVGIFTKINQRTTADTQRSPRSRTKPVGQRPCRSYSQVASHTPRHGESCTHQCQSRVISSPKCRENLRQTRKTTQPNYARSKSHISPRWRIKTLERSPCLTPRKLEIRQVSRSKDLKQNCLPRTLTPVPRSNRNLCSKIEKSHQIVQSKPLSSLRNKQGQSHTYEKKTKVKQCCFERQTTSGIYEAVRKEKRKTTYKEIPQQSNKLLESKNLQIEDFSRPQYKSLINDLSETSSTTRSRNYNIIKPNVIDDSTYAYPGDDDTEDYIIIPYYRTPLEDQTNERKRLSESVRRNSEVLVEDASNASIGQIKQNTTFKDSRISDSPLHRSHSVKEIYYESESKRGSTLLIRETNSNHSNSSDLISRKPHSIEVKQINRDPKEERSPTDTKEIFYVLESTRTPLDPIFYHQYDTNDPAYKLELGKGDSPTDEVYTFDLKDAHFKRESSRSSKSSKSSKIYKHKVNVKKESPPGSYQPEKKNGSPSDHSLLDQDVVPAESFSSDSKDMHFEQESRHKILKTYSRTQHHAERRSSDLSSQKYENDSLTNRPSQSHDSASVRAFKQKLNPSQEEVQQNVKANPKSCPCQRMDSSLLQSEKYPSVRLSHGSVSSKTNQQEGRKTKSKTCQFQIKTSTSSLTKVSKNQNSPRKSHDRQTNTSASLQSYKTEESEPKPFRSEINYATSYIKEEKPFKSDQEFEPHEQIDTPLHRSHKVEELYYESQFETKEMMRRIESNREGQIKDVISEKTHSIEVKEIYRDPEEASSPTDAKEMYYNLESTLLNDVPSDPIHHPQYETKDAAYELELGRESQRGDSQFAQVDLADSKDTRSQPESSRSSKSSKSTPRSYKPAKKTSSSSDHSLLDQNFVPVASPKTNQQQGRKTKSKTCQCAHTSTSSLTEISKIQNSPRKSCDCQTSTSASLQSYKSEEKELSLKPKPFHSEIISTTPYVKEEKASKSDQELKPYEQMSEEMSNRLQSSKIHSESVPSKMEDQSIVKQESGSHTSEISHEYLFETPNPIQPIKGVDSEIVRYIQNLEDRLRDCDNMVKKQMQKKLVCPRQEQPSIYNGHRSGQQQQIVVGSRQNLEHERRAQQNDIRHSPSGQTETDAEDESRFHMKKREIGELIIPLDLDQFTESDLKSEDECHCYRCEEAKLSPIPKEIPPFTGCDCMKEDYYKIMRVVYNQ